MEFKEEFKLGYQIYEPENDQELNQNRVFPIPERTNVESSMSFGEALYKGSIIPRAGDGIARRLSAEILGTNKKDESYNPFDAWKEAGADDSLFRDFMETENNTELTSLLLRLNEEKERRKAIEEYGLAGEAADFVFNVGTDPTTYLGFGVGLMLKSGIGFTKAFAVAGAASGVASVALEEFASPEQMNLELGLTTVAASTVFSGLMGGAVDTYARLKAKGLIKKDFQTMSEEAMDSDNNFPVKRPMVGLSADVVQNPLENYDASVAGVKAIKALVRGTALTLQTPRALLQTAESKEISSFSSRFYGQVYKSESNIKGEAGYVYNFGDETQKTRDLDKVWIANNLTDDIITKKFGKALDEDDVAVILRATFDPDYDLSTLTDVQRYVIDKNREFYDGKKLEFENNGTSYFHGRDNYGFPLQFSIEKVVKNINAFEEKTFNLLVAIRNSAEEAIEKVGKQIDELKAKIDETPDPRFKGPLEAHLQHLEDVAERYRIIAASDDGTLRQEAANTALNISRGDFSSNSPLPEGASKTKSKFFNERIIDPLDFEEFIDTDFASLAARYSDSTSPYLALSKAFPEYKNIDEVIEGLSEKANENIGSYKDPEKIKSEIDKAQKLFRRSWDQETGIERARKVSDLGDYKHLVSALDSLSYMSQMGGQVFAALVEPFNAMIFHGLKYGTDLVSVIGKTINDPLARQIVKEEANRFGIAIEVHNANFRMATVASDITQAELQSKITRNLKKGAIKFSKLNLSVYFDSFTRSVANIAQQGIIRDNLFKYAKLSDDLKGDLAFLGIDSKNIEIIKDQLTKHGTEYRGMFLSNVDKWDDRLAADTWVNAIRKDQRRFTAQADLGDVAHVYRTPVGQLFMKYKTWPTVATQKLAIGSIMHGKKALPGVAAVVSIASFVEYLEEFSKGKEPSTDPEEILYGGVVRAGLLGLFPDVGGSYMLNRLAGIESGGAKYYSYMDLGDAVAGPVGAMVEDVGRAGFSLLPKYSDGEYRMGYETKKGEVSKGSINSVIDVLPIPLVKPWLKEGINQSLE